MSGDRKPGDGNVRRDVPGGFPGDKTDEFTRAGRSAMQNEAYDYMSNLLQWRKTSEDVMKHLDPADYIGCCPQQVDRFLAECVQPVLDKYPEALKGTGTEIKV